MQQIAWHTLNPKQTLSALHSSPQGLTADDVTKRQQQYGCNRLQQTTTEPIVIRILRQFQNVLIYILLISAIITASLQQWVDTGVILGVVIINAFIGLTQENRAEKALQAIRHLLALQSKVIRDSKRQCIASEQLVPGDIIQLKSGDKVPADCRLLNNNNLQTQEALLTGESEPIIKSTQAIEAINGPLGERHCMLYAGTMVIYGSATAIVVNIGKDTELGKISTLIQSTEKMMTPLLKQMSQFAYHLTLAILCIALFTISIGWLGGHYSLNELFLAAVGLAVAAIPQGLPALMTMALAIGVINMAKQHAIVRRLPAIEALGSVSVICTDKTGTLTRNEMMVQHVLTPHDKYTATGDGYQPAGDIMHQNTTAQLEQHTELKQLIIAGILCNDAELNQHHKQWELQGNPTDGALLALAAKSQLDIKHIKQIYHQSDVIPFESEYQLMATLHHDHLGNGWIIVKGAPEKILQLCQYQTAPDGKQTLDQQHWLKRCHQLAKQGLRIIAIAKRPCEAEKTVLQFNDIESNLILLGVVGMIDSFRQSAPAAVTRCQQAGITINMITGDHRSTAIAIAKQVGIDTSQGALNGDDLDQLDDHALGEAVKHYHVFARTSPQHKLRLVNALQANQEVVAMTGDGANDAPALRRANVGVAMGSKGTEAAKESAEIVLADDNFSSLAHAVSLGRTIYQNLIKAIFFILPTNGGEASIIILAIFLEQLLPITPAQILWINMVTAITLGFSLAFEPSHQNVMLAPPRKPNAAIFSPLLLWRIVFVTIILVAGTYGLFLWQLHHNHNIEQARCLAVNTLVMGEIVYLINSRRLYTSCFNWSGLTGNRVAVLAIIAVILLQLTFTYYPVMQQLFSVEAISFNNWLMVIGFGIILFTAVELEKLFNRKRKRSTSR